MDEKLIPKAIRIATCVDASRSMAGNSSVHIQGVLYVF